MKTVILAALLLLAVASIVSGAPKESDIAPGDEKEIIKVSGEADASGKSLYGDETCFTVILQALLL